MKKFYVSFGVVLIFALLLANMSYSHWSKAVNISGYIHTGTLDAEWVTGKTWDTEYPLKDYSSITATAYTGTPDLVVKINNAYPSIDYYACVGIKNTGTIPLHINDIVKAGNMPHEESWNNEFVTWEIDSVCPFILDLPSKLTITKVQNGGGPVFGSYFDITVDVSETCALEDAVYAGWCVDYDTPIGGGPYSNVLVYNSLNYQPYVPGTYVRNSVEQWDKINWLINAWGTTDYPKATYSYTEVENAIWHFVGDKTYASLSTDEKKLVDDANLYGEGYTPGPHDKLAVILNPGSTVQLCIIEVDLDTVDCLKLEENTQVHPGEIAYGTLHIHLPQTTVQGTTYDFRFIVDLVQWNAEV